MNKQDKPSSSKLPKGAYRLPTGGYVTVGRWTPVGPSGKRQIRIVAVHRDPPDMDKLARALIALADQMSKEEQKNRPKG
jgi:hypothetical protein